MRKEITAKLLGLGHSGFFLGVLVRNACMDTPPD